MHEDLFELVRKAAVTNHDERLAIVVRLCQALKSGELSFDEARRLVLSYELSSDEVGVIAQLLSDDMVISKQFRFRPENNRDVYSLIILSIIEYRHFERSSYTYLKQAFNKLIIISPPQPEIVTFLSNLLSINSRSCRTVEEENENKEMREVLENFLEKI